MKKEEPVCRSIDYSRLGIVVSKGLMNSRKGSTTFIRSSRGWVYKHKPSREYIRRLEELRFKTPGISNNKRFIRRTSDRDRIYEEKEKRMNNCAKLLHKIILRYNVLCDDE